MLVSAAKKAGGGLLRPLATQLGLKASTTAPALLFSAGCFGAVNVVGFGVTAICKTHKITDLTGTGAFALSAAANMYRNFGSVLGIGGAGSKLAPIPMRVRLLNTAVGLWSARLAGYLFARILITGEDERLGRFFPEKDEGWLDSDKSNFPVNLAGFWTIQAMWGWVVSLPIALATFNAKRYPVPPIGLFGKAAFACFGLGLLIEGVADYQKFVFKQDKTNKDKWIQSGLWGLSRHPNYFGEILMWMSLFAGAVPLLRGPTQLALGALSPAFITGLIMFVSGVPLLEEKSDAKYGEEESYKAYKEEVPLLVPSPLKALKALL